MCNAGANKVLCRFNYFLCQELFNQRFNPITNLRFFHPSYKFKMKHPSATKTVSKAIIKSDENIFDFSATRRCMPIWNEITAMRRDETVRGMRENEANKVPRRFSRDSLASPIADA